MQQGARRDQIQPVKSRNPLQAPPSLASSRRRKDHEAKMIDEEERAKKRAKYLEELEDDEREKDGGEGERAMEMEETEGGGGGGGGSTTSKGDRKRCPYLDTVNRHVLDFDMEKVCSITLTNLNVYSCLVCGKFFQGRGKSTPAYTHSVQCGHFVFINLHDARTFCLPDNYEVVDSSLDDVKCCLSPRFSATEIASLDQNDSLARDVNGIAYLPGFVGMNNLNNSAYINVILHALSHVQPLRDFFLQPELYAHCKSSLVTRLGECIRKLWSAHNFKCVVSPQELVHEISLASKKFNLGQSDECIELLNWLLGELNRGLGFSKKNPSTIVTQCFQGVVEITEMTKLAVPVGDKEWETKSKKVPFNYLRLDIPPPPLFRDAEGGLIIPRIPIFDLLRKFDGTTWSELISVGSHVRKKYRIHSLPQFLVFHLTRFNKNNFFLERNPTIVTFPIKNLELRDYYFPEDALPSIASLNEMSIGDLKGIVNKYGNASEKREMSSAIDKTMLLGLATSALTRANSSATKYDLVASVVANESSASSSTSQIAKEGKAVIPSVSSVSASSSSSSSSASSSGSGAAAVASSSYKINVVNKKTGLWFAIEDLECREILPSAVCLEEAVLLIFSRS